MTGMVAPIYALLEGKSAKQTLISEPNELKKQSFEVLKQAVISPAVLKLTRVSDPIEIDTDSCKHHKGLTVFQNLDEL